jgi:hypothetical protein
MSEVITVTCADAIADGFIPEGEENIQFPYCDAIFLDVSPFFLL